MCPHTGRRRVARLASAVTVLALGSGALASAAAAASVKVTVPSQVKTGKGYGIRVGGTFTPSELTGRAYLIAAIQFANHPCRATAQAENATTDFVQWYLIPKSELKLKHPKHVGVFESKSPFNRFDTFKAGEVSTRHVCAWLYPKFIGAGDTTKPIARADKKYRVTKA